MTGIAIGYHGTTKNCADKLLAGANFIPSSNKGDWLGSGIYFFQDSPLRAWHWAKIKANSEHDEPAILIANIRLDNSIDLLDIDGYRSLLRYRNSYLRAGFGASQVGLEVAGGDCRPPLDEPNLVDRNRLDKSFLDYAVSAVELQCGETIDVIRSAFLLGKAIMPSSFLFNWSHVQICVRNSAAIDGDLSLWQKRK